MKIVNILLKNKKLVGSFGSVEFDSDGMADVDNETAEQLLELGNYVRADGDAISPKKKPEPPKEILEEGEPEETDSEDEEETDFSSMNVPQLKKYAREHGIDLGDASKKDEILEILNA